MISTTPLVPSDELLSSFKHIMRPFLSPLSRGIVLSMDFDQGVDHLLVLVISYGVQFKSLLLLKETLPILGKEIFTDFELIVLEAFWYLGFVILSNVNVNHYIHGKELHSFLSRGVLVLL